MARPAKRPLIVGLTTFVSLTVVAAIVLWPESGEHADPQPRDVTVVAATHFTSQAHINNCQVTGEVPDGVLKAEPLGDDCVVTIDRTQHSIRLVATAPDAMEPTIQSTTARQDIMASWRQGGKVYTVVYPKANNLFCFLFTPDQAAQPLPDWAGATGLPAIEVPRYGEAA